MIATSSGIRDSVFDGIVHRTRRQRIVVAKDAVRFWLEVQELSHRVRTSLFGIYVDLSHRRDVTAVDRDSAAHQRPLVSFQPGDSRTGLRPADVRDPFASDRDQVFSGEPADGNIVDSDIVRGGARDRCDQSECTVSCAAQCGRLARRSGGRRR